MFPYVHTRLLFYTKEANYRVIQVLPVLNTHLNITRLYIQHFPFYA